MYVSVAFYESIAHQFFSQPLTFNVTMSRTYKWQTENRDDQANFLDAFVRLFRILYGPQTSLCLDGLQDHEISAGTPHDLCSVQELMIHKSARTVRTH